MKLYLSWGIVGVVMLMLAAGGWWLAVNRLDRPEGAETRLIVGATIFPLADIVEQIGGERVRVVQVLPVGASEHDYSLTPRQVAELQQAKALFAIGQGLDDWATQGIPAEKVIVVDRGIDLKEFGAAAHEEEYEEEGDDHAPGAIDPHYWLTVPNGAIIAETVAVTLQELDPVGRDLYEVNLERYLAELAVLEGELQTMASGADQKEFIAVHDAWSYLAEHYGFELVATYEPVEGQEPSIADIRHLQEVVEEYGVTRFFTEPQKQSTGATRFLRDDLGLDIRILDPVGGVEGRDSYIEMMRHNITALAQGQG